MLLQVVVVRDSAINAFGTPYFVTHTGSAVRGFTDGVNTPQENSNLYKHPADFVLWHLGTYDDLDARFDLFPSPVQLVRAVDVLKNKLP